MFTGLIAEKGRVERIIRQTAAVEVTIAASAELLKGYEIGDSMALDGVCTTAIAVEQQRFTVEMMSETLRKTHFTHLVVGQRVNLERALAFQGRVEGHFVTGHVDQTVRVQRVVETAGIRQIYLDYPKALAGQLIAQGSVALNGVSLTVARVSATNFMVAIIPHTLRHTTLATIRNGSLVHIETDLFAKYIQQRRVGTEASNGANLARKRDFNYDQ